MIKVLLSSLPKKYFNALLFLSKKYPNTKVELNFKWSKYFDLYIGGGIGYTRMSPEDGIITFNNQKDTYSAKPSNNFSYNLFENSRIIKFLVMVDPISQDHEIIES